MRKCLAIQDAARSTHRQSTDLTVFFVPNDSLPQDLFNRSIIFGLAKTDPREKRTVLRTFSKGSR